MRLLLPPDRGAVRGTARAAVLAEWMTSWLGTHVDVDIAPNYRELARAIERGTVELAWTPPVVVARVRAHVRTVLTVVRSGATACSAALVVRARSDIRELRDLAGMRASWVDPLSLSGHLMALIHLQENGLDPQRLFVSQRFAGSYRDALVDVINERTDVCSVFVVDGDTQGTMREIHDIAGPGASSLTVLSMTAPAPYDALVVPASSTDSRELEERILALHQRMRPPAMLLEVCRADRFVRSSGREYAQLERLVDTTLDV